MAGLTEKQKLFCDEYLINNGNGTQAAITAGYSEKTAGQIAEQNLKKLEISNYIKERTEKASNDRIMSIAERKEKLTTLAREKGNGDTKDAIKAIDTLNRMDQVYLERVEHSGNLKVVKASKDDQSL